MEEKASLSLKTQTFNTYTQEKETISCHKLLLCFKPCFPGGPWPQGPPHLVAGPCPAARLVRKQTTQAISNDKQTLMNFGACLVLAFMDCKIIWLLLTPC